MTGRERNLERPELHRLPVIELVDNVKTEIVDQISNSHRNGNWLISCDAPQGAPVEMIEMSVRHQNEIDRWQVMNFKARLLQSFDDLKPLRPDRIDQNIDFVRLNQKRSVSNPRDANFAVADFRELRPRMITGALGEKRRDEDAGEKIALVPVRRRAQSHPRGTLCSCAIPGRLANDISPTFL